MKYPSKEKKDASKQAYEHARCFQAKQYSKADSFEEYAVACAVNGIQRKYKYLCVDPFWVHYVCMNHGYYTVLLSAMALTFAAYSLVCFVVALAFHLGLPACLMLECLSFAMAFFLGVGIANCFREASRWILEILQ